MIWPLLAACAPTPPPDIVFVTLDTTRPDALGPYGNPRDPTPTLDDLARDGVVFTDALTVAPLTLPAHTSIFTGQYLDRTGVLENQGFQVPESTTTLAEVLHRSGWRTGAFIGAIVLDASYGLDQGFDFYDDEFDTSSDDHGETVARWTADVVADRAIRWCADDDPAPRFTWVHFYDAHQPLAPPEPFRSAFADPYEAAVAFTDAQVARVLGACARPGRPRVVVVVADHGESRGDHGELTHGWFAYRATTKVPLIIAGDGVAAGRTSAAPVSAVDLVPTLLDWLHLPALNTDGISLAAVLTGDAPIVRPEGRFSASYGPRFGYGFAELRAVQDGQWRLVDAPRDELYDIDADPNESADRIADQPGVAAGLVGLLNDRAVRFPVVFASSLDAPAASELAALGYTSGSSTPDSSPASTLPDPKDAPDMVQRVEHAIVAARRVPPEAGGPILETLLRDNPGVVRARELLSRSRELQGDLAGARAALQPMLEARPHDARIVTRVAQLLADEGRLAEAADVLAPVISAGTTWPSTFAVRADIARRQGDCAAALTFADRGLALSPETLSLRLVRGTCRLETDDITGAIDDLQVVRAGDADNTDVGFMLGSALARAGRLDEAIVLYEEQVRRTPDRALARAALGMALYARGRASDAVPYLQSAYDADPQVDDVLPLMLADALLATGDAGPKVGLLLDDAERRAPGKGDVAAVRASWEAARAVSGTTQPR